MRSDTDQRGWRQRRSDQRAEEARPAHAEVEEQLKVLSSQWRRKIVSHTTGLRPRLDAEHDNVRGSANAKVTLVEYGDFESKSCKAAAPVILKLADTHPLAIGASFAAAGAPA